MCQEVALQVVVTSEFGGTVGTLVLLAGRRSRTLSCAGCRQAHASSCGIGGLWGFIRPDGSVAIAPRYDEVREFTGGLAAVREGGLWGYLRPDGTFAVAPRFSEAAPFRGALARVVESGSAAYVDATGATVWRETAPAPTTTRSSDRP